jgi:crossover junction endodeoxyribonuclease RuvC
MLILGIDPGTATTGFGVIKLSGDGNTILVDHGLIETNKEEDPGWRLSEIYRQMEVLIREHKPQVLAMEKVFFFSNQKTVIRVSQAQGVILLIASHLGIPVFEYAPGQVKLQIGGNGRADKKLIQFAIKEMFGLVAQKNKKTHFDNAADAIAIALTHVKYITGTALEPQSKSKKKAKKNEKVSPVTV